MDRRFAWLGAGVGALAVWRWRRRRQTVEEDPAEALRAKLEESRAAAEPESPPAVADHDPDTRRRAVHEDARARMDELRGQ